MKQARGFVKMPRGDTKTVPGIEINRGTLGEGVRMIDDICGKAPSHIEYDDLDTRGRRVGTKRIRTKAASNAKLSYRLIFTSGLVGVNLGVYEGFASLDAARKGSLAIANDALEYTAPGHTVTVVVQEKHKAATDRYGLIRTVTRYNIVKNSSGIIITDTPETLNTENEV